MKVNVPPAVLSKVPVVRLPPLRFSVPVLHTLVVPATSTRPLSAIVNVPLPPTAVELPPMYKLLELFHWLPLPVTVAKPVDPASLPT